MNQHRLKKLIALHLTKKFPAFNTTRLFITVFTKARYSFLTYIRSIQSMPLPNDLLEYYPPIYTWVFQVVPLRQVSLPKPYIHLSFFTCVPHDPPTSLFLTWCHTSNTQWAQQIANLLIMQFSSLPCYLGLLVPAILRITLFSNTLSLYSYRSARDQVLHPYKTTGDTWWRLKAPSSTFRPKRAEHLAYFGLNIAPSFVSLRLPNTWRTSDWTSHPVLCHSGCRTLGVLRTEHRTQFCVTPAAEHLAYFGLNIAPSFVSPRLRNTWRTSDWTSHPVLGHSGISFRRSLVQVSTWKPLILVAFFAIFIFRSWQVRRLRLIGNYRFFAYRFQFITD